MNNNNNYNNLTAEGKKLSRSKDPERHIRRRCTITITICNSDDVTFSRNAQPDTNTVHRKKKNQPPKVHVLYSHDHD